MTSQGCFGQAKMAAMAQPANFKRLEKPYTKKKYAMFPSKVQIILLSKNLTYENFVSVALTWHLGFLTWFSSVITTVVPFSSLPCQIPNKARINA